MDVCVFQVPGQPNPSLLGVLLQNARSLLACDLGETREDVQIGWDLDTGAALGSLAGQPRGRPRRFSPWALGGCWMKKLDDLTLSEPAGALR